MRLKLGDVNRNDVEKTERFRRRGTLWKVFSGWL